MSIILQSMGVGSGTDITSNAQIATGTVNRDGVFYIKVALSAMTNGAATVDFQVIKDVAGVDYVMWEGSWSKTTGTLLYYMSPHPFVMNYGETIEVWADSSNGSDSNVTCTVELVDSFSNVLVATVVGTTDTTSHFQFGSGDAVQHDDAYNGCSIVVVDADDNEVRVVRQVVDYTGNGKHVYLDEALPFTPASDDPVFIYPANVKTNITNWGGNDIRGQVSGQGYPQVDAVTVGNGAPLTTGGLAPSLVQQTTIATLATQTSFTLTAGSTDDDTYNGCLVRVTDAGSSAQRCIGRIADYTVTDAGATKTVTLSADPGIFTIAAGDTVDIMATQAAAYM